MHREIRSRTTHPVAALARGEVPRREERCAAESRSASAASEKWPASNSACSLRDKRGRKSPSSSSSSQYYSFYTVILPSAIHDFITDARNSASAASEKWPASSSA